MSEAFLYKGLTFECGISTRLTIEGRSIPVEKSDEGFRTPLFPGVEAESVQKLAELVIDRSTEYDEIKGIKKEHLALLRKGVEVWNDWRSRNREIRPTLSNADLSRKTLSHADFSYADLCQADLSGATLIGANFHQANLAGADLQDVDLTDANFCRADLYGTKLARARLIHTNLQGAQLAKTNFEGAHLIGCKVYGMAAWDLKLKDAEQNGLIVRYRYKDENEAEITVDDLQIAQFVYLLLINENVRSFIDTVTSKVVLILGRFTDERKRVLDAVRDALRQKDLIPILFDFAIPTNRNVRETVKVLAGLAKFVVADVTDATEVRAELESIVPDFPRLPIQPLVLDGRPIDIHLRDLLDSFPRVVLPPFKYLDLSHLLANLDDAVIGPATVKHRELTKKQGRP